MRNILTIFITDVHHLVRNVIAAIVVMGLILVPPLYAWFTTAGFWDPYNNTGDLKVAVACDDEGYSGSELPVSVNVGEDVLSEIRANKQFDWIITDTADAVKGVKSGRYYAAIVIPRTFSRDLMGVLGGDVRHASIDYYSNEKENAIAPRVTDTGATTLQDTIDKAFTKAVSGVVLKSTSNVVGVLDGEGVADYANGLLKRLDEALATMDSAKTQVSAFSGLLGATAGLLDATGKVLDEGAQEARDVAAAGEEEASGLATAQSALDGANDLLDKAFQQGSDSLDALKSQIDSAFDGLPSDEAATADTLAALGKEASALKTAYETVRADLAKVDPDSPALTQLDKAVAALGQAQDTLSTLASDASALHGLASSERSRLADELSEARSSLDETAASYRDGLQASVQKLAATLEDVRSAGTDLGERLASTAGSLSAATGSLSSSLRSAQDSLTATAAALENAEGQLQTSRDDLQAAVDAGDLDKVRALIGPDPEKLASFLSAPTQLKRHAVFAMANNGSAMSPFYTSLSLWIAALFNVVMINVNVSDKLRERLQKPRQAQLYLGRYGVFALIALAQATTVCLGNVFFLGVQCEHLWLYLLAGWWVAVVFGNLVYTLTLSFGSIGKAIAIIGLVMQLGGSGGIFPIQLSGPVFQAIYPWLPFDYSMSLFEGCIAGIYGNQYWLAFGKLGLFLAGSLVLGLVLRRPVIKMNDRVLGKLHETKLV